MYVYNTTLVCIMLACGTGSKYEQYTYRSAAFRNSGHLHQV